MDLKPYFIQNTQLPSSGWKSWRRPVAKAAAQKHGLLQADCEGCTMSPHGGAGATIAQENLRQLFPRISLRLLARPPVQTRR